MTFQSTQITPEEAKYYAELGRKQGEAERAAQPGLRVSSDSGVYRMNTHDGVVTHEGVMRSTTADFKTAGIVGSLGLTKQSPKAVVDIGGMQTTMEIAHSLGLIGKDPHTGLYYDLDTSKKVR